MLERTPVPARRSGGIVVLANWSFRVRADVVEGRPTRGGWRVLARSPFCMPDVPREALEALHLRPLTPDGGCFGLRAAPR